MYRDWTTALLGDSTQSAADMIVDASTSSEGLFKKHMLMEQLPCCVVELNQVSRIVH